MERGRGEMEKWRRGIHLVGEQSCPGTLMADSATSQLSLDLHCLVLDHAVCSCVCLCV